MDVLWAPKSECLRLIVRVISFQDFQPMWSTNVTDRQTDGRTDGWTDGRTDNMRSQYRALHYSASRGKNVKVGYLLLIALLTPARLVTNSSGLHITITEVAADWHDTEAHYTAIHFHISELWRVKRKLNCSVAQCQADGIEFSPKRAWVVW